MITPATTIQTNKIPAVDAKVLARTFLSAVTAFYENPQNAAKFEEWKKQRHNAQIQGGN